MKRLTLYLLFLTVLLGCLASVPINYLSYTKRLFTNYNTGQLVSCSVGDPIFQAEYSPVLDAYEVLFDYQPPTKGITGDAQPQMEQGDRYTAIALDPEAGNSILLRPENASGNPMLIHIFPDGRINKGWVYSQGLKAAQGDWISKPLFVKSSDPSRGQRAFKCQIIFSGLSGNTIKAVYREFVDDYARPAFSQDLQYNLDESKEIAYKTVKIQVIKVSNSSIDFKVIDDGGLQWLRR